MKIKELKRDIKYAYQRVVRGYDDMFIWEMRSEHSRLMIKALKQFKESHVGSPIIRKKDLHSKNTTNNCHTYWTSILDKMITGFEAKIALDNFPEKKQIKKLEKQWNEGIQLFIKHYDSLWD